MPRVGVSDPLTSCSDLYATLGANEQICRTVLAAVLDECRGILETGANVNAQWHSLSIVIL